MTNCFLKIFVLLGLVLGLMLGSSGYAATRRPAEVISNNRRINIKGSDELVTRTKKAPDFHAVSASRAVGVIIGGTNEIVIEANDNLVDYVVVEAKNGTLEISMSDKVNARNMFVTVRIPNNGKIDAIQGASGAAIRTESALKASDMEIHLASAASLDAAMKVDRCSILLASGSEMKTAADFGQCNISLASGAELRLSGKADSMVATVASGAELNAYALVARLCDVAVASGGEAEVNCSKQLTACAASGGEVKYKGECEVDKQSSSGGTIKKR